MSAANFLRIKYEKSKRRLKGLSQIVSLCALTLGFLIIAVPIKAEPQKNIIVVSGSLTFEKLEEIVKQLREQPQVKVVRFENCLGGQQNVSEALAEYIRKSGMKTIAAGKVNSGCHLAFLAGTPRELASSEEEISMQVHSPSRNGQIARAKDVDRFMQLIILYSDGKLPAKYLKYIRESHGEGAGLVFFSKCAYGKVVQRVEVCHQATPLESTVCRMLEYVSFYDIGLTTQLSEQKKDVGNCEPL